MAVTTVIGIPGQWTTRSELVQAIAQQGYILAGAILMNPANQQKWEIELYDSDPNLARAFQVAGRGTISQEVLDQITSNTYTVYIIAEGETLAAAHATMEAANTIVAAGGIAVKVESSGVGHSGAKWRLLSEAAEHDDVALYQAFVTLVANSAQQLYYTCGMHNLGLRDVLVAGSFAPQEVMSLLQTFALYTLLGKPEIVSGQTFSPEPGTPVYTITAEKCTFYPEDDLFYNPFGIWRLSKRA